MLPPDSARPRSGAERSGVLALLAVSLVAASIGTAPLVADAQAPARPAILELEIVTEGATGGPFPVRVARDQSMEPVVEVMATTEHQGTPTAVTGVPPLAAGTYTVGVDLSDTPPAVPGAVWRWTDLTCGADDQPVGIDRATGLATLSLAEGSSTACVVTLAPEPPGDPAPPEDPVGDDDSAPGPEPQPEPPAGDDPESEEPEQPGAPVDGSTTTTMQAQSPPSADDPAGEGPDATVGAAADDPPIVIQQGPNQGTVRVRKAGGRSGPAPTQLTPLAGATFGAYRTQADATNRVNAVGTCVTGADGTCEIHLDAAALTGTTYYIREISAPPGYFVMDQIGAGPYTNPRMEPYIEPVRVTRNNVTVSPANQTVSGLGNPDIPRSFADPLDNPDVPPECGLDIAMVVDVSTSVDGGEMTQMKNALRAAATGLVGTPTRLAMFSFGTRAPAATAPANLSITSVTDSATPVVNWINALPANPATGPTQLTNWDQGLFQVANSPTTFDVLLMLTDGDPTVWGPNGNQDALLPTVARSATELAVASANSVKAQGTQIIGAGIGGEGVSLENIESISGPGDVYSASFAGLSDLLQDLAVAGCQGSVTVQKATRTGTTGAFAPAAGWTISTPTVGVTPASGVTAEVTGATSFAVDFGETPVTRDVTFTETLQPGYSLVPQDGANARCTSGGGATVLPVTNSGALGFNVPVAPTAIVTCTIQNQFIPTTLTLVKEVTNDDGGTAAPADWTLSAAGPTPISGPSGSAAVTDAAVGAGTYTLSESGGPSGYTASDWSCTGATQSGATVTVAAGQSATCTITNDDQPALLTLVKVVDNQFGGTAEPGDWTLQAAGGRTISGASGTPAVTAQPVPAGVYTLTEFGPPGYVEGAWSCARTGAPPVRTPGDTRLGPGDDVTCTITNTDAPATLTLVKQVTNDDGGTAAPTDWTLTADGPTIVTGSTGDVVVTNRQVQAGTYLLSEAGPAGYEASAWACTGGSLAGAALTLAPGADATCTITNDDQPATLTLVKEVDNQFGGTAAPTDWTLIADGPTPVTGTSGTPAVTGVEVLPGSYDLAEADGPGGYEASDWACTGATPATDDTVAVALGQAVTCTIINTHQPAELTLVKEVVNDDGGEAAATDWTLSATGPTPISGVTGDPAVTDVPVNPGSYALSETTDVTGYEPSDWDCGEEVAVTGGVVELAAGDDVTCTITNDDVQATLTLVKEVVNDDGGTAEVDDWTLIATGPSGVFSGTSGEVAVTEIPVAPGSYSLVEDGPPGYTASWDCIGQVAPLPAPDLVLVGLGEQVTCTVTNDDQPATLTLQKAVVNDDGGTAVDTDWTLTATGPTPGLTGVEGDPAITGATVVPGTYTLSEDGPDGYEAGPWACEGGTLVGDELTVTSGESVTCTVTNDDRGASLTLQKQVINDDGGTAAITDWTLSATGPTPGITGVSGSPSVTAVDVAPGTYSLAEAGGPSGYEASDWVCTGGVQVDGATVTVALGQAAVCFIVNDDVAPTLTLVKTVINDDGGTAVPTDWTLSAAETTTGVGFEGVSGSDAVTSVPVPAGEYVITELPGPSGYVPLGWVCVGATRQFSAVVTLGVGQNVTCTIGNDDVAPGLTLVKRVVNDDGGMALDTSWTLTATGPTPGISGPVRSPEVTAVDVEPGTYTLSESGGPPGYAASDWVCEGATSQDGADVTIDLGQSVACTIENDDVPATLTLVKEVVNDHGGTAASTDWTLTASGRSPGISGPTGDDAVTAVTVLPGDYTVAESDGPPGYTASDWTCVGGPLAGVTVSVTLGADVTCTITNDDDPAQLTLLKDVVNDHGGTAVDTDWTLAAAGPTTGVSGVEGDPAVTAAAVAAGTYELSESGPDGYTAGNWTCEGGTLDDASVTVGQGESVTCTITNDDDPARLTLVKEVVNDDGGTAAATDWLLGAAGPVSVTGPTGSVEVTGAVVAAGTYTLREFGPSGYEASGWSCTGGTLEADVLTLALGDDATCTIANDDLPAELTLVKEVVNDSGGTATATDWTLTADGPTAGVSGVTGSAAVTTVPVEAGTYDLSETGPEGYDASDWTCTGGTLAGESLELALGESATCTIINDDQPSTLTLVKEVVNDNGGTAPVGAWILGADGPTPGVVGVTGAPAVTDAPVLAGEYVLSESSGVEGYDASDWVCEGGPVEGTTVTVPLGASVVCAITNDDQPVTLTLVKEVVNDDGGSAAPTDWTLDAAGRTAGVTGPSGSAAVTDVTVLPGSYALSEAGGPAGYEASDWSCDGGTLSGTTLSLVLGDSVVCTIVNDDQPSSLTLVKEVVNDDGGTQLPTAWTLTADGPTTGITGPTGDAAVTEVPVLPGDYALSEAGGPAGYAPSDWTCEGGAVDGATVSVGLGDSVVCTIVNDDQPALLTLVKEVVNDNTGTAVPTDWTLTATGPSTVSGATGDEAVTQVPVAAGNYTLTESGPAGYEPGEWACIGGVRRGIGGVTLGLGEEVVCTITNDDQPPGVSIDKATTATTFVPGDDVPYSITVSNTGEVPAVDVRVTDTLPAGLTFVSSPDGCTSADGVTFTCGLGDLPAGGSVTVDVVTRAADPFPSDAVTEAGEVPNTATVTSPGSNCPEDGSGGDECSSTVIVAITPRLTIQKTSTVDRIVPGGDVAYELTVTNTTPVEATSVTVTDLLPAGLTFLSSPSGCASTDGVTIVCELGTVPGDGSVTVAVVTRAADPFPPDAVTETGEVPNTATVTSPGSTCPDDGSGDPDECSSTELVPLQPQLSIDKATTATQIVPGGEVPYAFTVTNAAPADAVDVTVTDVLPLGLTFVSSPDGCTASADDRTITCALGGLPADTSVTVSVLTLAADPFPPDAVDPSGLVPNTATVTSPESNCPPDRPGGEECSSTTVLPPQPQVAIVKGSTAVQIVPGAPVPYAITVTNTGVVPAPDVMVTDVLPAGLTLVSAGDADCTSPVGVTVVCALGDLAVGASVTVDLVVLAADPFPADAVDAAGRVPNTAVVTSPGTGCDVPMDAPGIVRARRYSAAVVQQAADGCESTVDVPLQPQVGITKSAGVDRIVPGSEVSYAIEVANTGPVTARDVVMADVLPLGLSYVSSDHPGCSLESGRRVTCALGSLEAGATVTVNVVTLAADPLPPGAIDASGGLANSATVTSPGSNCDADAVGAAVIPQAIGMCASTVVVPPDPEGGGGGGGEGDGAGDDGGVAGGDDAGHAGGPSGWLARTGVAVIGLLLAALGAVGIGLALRGGDRALRRRA